MSSIKKSLIVVVIMTLALVATVAGVSASDKSDIQGLVFIDDNLNGVWDVGEAGYGGEMQWDENIEMHRYVGTNVTVITPSYEEITVETLPYREPAEHEDVVCTQQDFIVDNEVNPNPVRPCSGTWGIPGLEDESYLEIWVAAPEGYYVTSPNPQVFLTGTDSGWVDFGIAPIVIGEGGTGGPVEVGAEVASSVVEEPVTPDEVSVVTDETADIVPTSWTMDVSGTGIPGLVFIDTNNDGVWQPGEPGYGGKLTWNEDTGMDEYVGATITLIPPSYDAIILTSAGYVEPAEGEDVSCTQQDFIVDNEVNPNPVRPCDGTWGLTHAGDDIYWEVWLTTPDGYTGTSANPQFYTSGSGQMPLDFGIVSVVSE